MEGPRSRRSHRRGHEESGRRLPRKTSGWRVCLTDCSCRASQGPGSIASPTSGTCWERPIRSARHDPRRTAPRLSPAPHRLVPRRHALRSIKVRELRRCGRSNALSSPIRPASLCPIRRRSRLALGRSIVHGGEREAADGGSWLTEKAIKCMQLSGPTTTVL